MDVAVPESLGFSASRLKRIHTAMQRLVDEGKIAGVVTVVGRHGKIAHAAAFGMSDVAAGKLMQMDTIFRIYSMTKPITAVAVMMLYEEGRFLLDDPVSRFIPEFANIKVFARNTANGIELTDLVRPVTIRHLLTHTSGLPYGSPTGTPVQKIHAKAIDSWPDLPLAEYAHRLGELPLAHQPGARWTYGISIDVLGRLVEVVSGQAFDAFLKQRLFDPLGMVDTGFYVPDKDLGRLAAVHTYGRDKRLVRMNVVGPQFEKGERPLFFSGGGGLVSTASDYAHFCQMLVRGGEWQGQRLLGPRTIKLMAANQLPLSMIPYTPPGWGCPVPGHGFGLGVATLMDPAQFGIPASVGTFTWMGLASTGMWIDPGEDLFGVTLLQFMPDSLQSTFREHQVLTYQALVD